MDDDVFKMVEKTHIMSDEEMQDMKRRAVLKMAKADLEGWLSSHGRRSDYVQLHSPDSVTILLVRAAKSYTV